MKFSHCFFFFFFWKLNQFSIFWPHHFVEKLQFRFDIIRFPKKKKKDDHLNIYLPNNSVDVHCLNPNLGYLNIIKALNYLCGKKGLSKKGINWALGIISFLSKRTSSSSIICFIISISIKELSITYNWLYIYGLPSATFLLVSSVALWQTTW